MEEIKFNTIKNLFIKRYNGLIELQKETQPDGALCFEITNRIDELESIYNEIRKIIKKENNKNDDLSYFVSCSILAEEWSKKEGWSVEYFDTKIKPKLNEAWQIEFKLYEGKDKEIAARGKMIYAYGKNKRQEITSETTFEAIQKGERTATTRFESNGHIDYWKKLKVGDIIEWKNAEGKKLLVEVTKPLSKLKVKEREVI